MQEIVHAALTESARLKTEALTQTEQIIEAATLIARSFSSGGRLFILGNGRAASEAQALSAGFMNRYVIERPPLPATALAVDGSLIMGLLEDGGGFDLFARQLKAVARAGDVVWVLAPSPQTQAVTTALTAARQLGLKAVVMAGAGVPDLRPLSDIHVETKSSDPARVQEVQLALGHVILELVDWILFQRPGEVAGL